VGALSEDLRAKLTILADGKKFDINGLSQLFFLFIIVLFKDKYKCTFFRKGVGRYEIEILKRREIQRKWVGYK
jgi:hypothetical protein